MEKKIEMRSSFEEVQETFNNLYPYLKIECLKSDNLKKVNADNKYLREKILRKKACIIINDNTTVADLVNQFKEGLHLAIRVLRKTNNLWIETSLTDNWTLERQNLAGKEFHTS